MESCHNHNGVMSHMQANESCHIEMSHVTHTQATPQQSHGRSASHVTSMMESDHTCEWATWHTDESSHTYKWDMLHVQMSHVTRTNEISSAIRTKREQVISTARLWLCCILHRRMRCMTWLIHTWDVTHSYVWCDSFTCCTTAYAVRLD